jgi:hypothetical protein
MSLWKVEALTPKIKIDTSQLKSVIVQEMTRQGEIIERMYERTTNTWRDKPKFSKTLKRGARTWIMRVGYDPSSEAGKKYLWTDWGTEPHIIRANKAPRLAFGTTFVPKTRRGVIGSGAGKRGGRIVRPKQVRHPGTEAREFTKTIYNRRKDHFSRGMAKAMQRAIRDAMKRR